MRRKLGVLYWKYYGKVKTWWYFRKKNWGRFSNWVSGWFCFNKEKTAKLSQERNVIICAHPDDETIFFSSILKSKKPFVICVSHRGNKERRREFYDALAFWGVEGTMLNFPDVPGLSFVWKWGMSASLSKLRKHMPSVTTVYTHSASGESGHPHHYAVNKGVKKAFSQCRVLTTATSVPEDGKGKLEDADLKEKQSMIRDCYPSQINMLEKWCPWWQSYLATEYFEE